MLISEEYIFKFWNPSEFNITRETIETSFGQCFHPATLNSSILTMHQG